MPCTKALAWYVIGLNQNELGEYIKAAEAFANSYKADPKHPYADYCLFENIRCYSKLAKKRKISRCNAFYNSYQFYDELMNLFPESQYCFPARKWLSICDDEK